MSLSSAEKSARYRAKDVEAYRAKKAAFARSPEQRAVRREYMKKWREENRIKFNEMCRVSHKKIRLNRTPDERHDQHLRSWYGMDRAEYLALLEEQNGGCAICGSASPGKCKSFAVDHCHVTHKIRGLLCNWCNARLGWFEQYYAEAVVYVTRDYSMAKEVRTPSRNKSMKSKRIGSL